METSAILDFFTLEAAACLERLDGLLARSGQSPPRLDEFLSDARTLRGTATMARQTPIAEVAAGLEQVTRELRDGKLAWTGGLRATVVATVDDLKVLVRNVRNWTSADDARAHARRDELQTVSPPRTHRSGEALAPGASSRFVAGELASIAVGLAADSEAGPDRQALLGVLPRVRALRGMAALRDVPMVADVLDAVETTAVPLERGADRLSQPARALMHAAAAFLRRAAADVQTGGEPDADGDEARRFNEARDAATGSEVRADAILPVAALFHDDAGPHVISAAPSPPTTSSQRFRMEVVSQAEHLRRLVADALSAANQAPRARAARGLANAIESLRTTSASFGEHRVAEFFGAHAASAVAFEPAALRALAEAGELLSDPRSDPALLSDSLVALAAGRAVDSAIGAGLTATDSPTPASIPVTEPRLADVLVERPATPSGSGLRALLQSGLAGFRSLDREPLAVPAPIDEDLPLIDAFVYRGRAALERARELRDSLRGRRSAPEREELDELFDLLDLASVE